MEIGCKFERVEDVSVAVSCQTVSFSWVDRAFSSKMPQYTYSVDGEGLDSSELHYNWILKQNTYFSSCSLSNFNLDDFPLIFWSISTSIYLTNVTINNKEVIKMAKIWDGAMDCNEKKKSFQYYQTNTWFYLLKIFGNVLLIRELQVVDENASR